MQRSISIVRIKRTLIASLYLSSLLFPLNSFADEGDVPKAATTDSGASSNIRTSDINDKSSASFLGFTESLNDATTFLKQSLLCEGEEGVEQANAAKATGDLETYNSINSAVEILTQVVPDQCKLLIQGGLAKSCVIEGVKIVKSAGESYKNNWERCTSTQNMAASTCLECNNKELAGSLSEVNLLLSGMGAMGVNAQCNTAAKALNIASMALTAFGTACGIVKSGCGVVCGSATGGLNDLKKATPKITFSCVAMNPKGNAECLEIQKMVQENIKELSEGVQKELAEGTLGSVAGKGKKCTGEYAKILVAALAGVQQMQSYKAKADACKAASAASASSASSTVDCSLAANASLPTCICEKNPRNPGCNNSLTKASSASAVGFTGTAAANTATASGTSGTTAGTAYSAGVSKVSNASGSIGSIGAASSGSPSSGSGLGADGQTAAAAAAAGEAGYVPMEYATEMSSMGGGSGWGGGAPAGDSAELEKFLPGGVEDPNAMSGEAFPQDVTTESGKSNWDKVRSRYSETKRTLIGN